MGMGLVLVMHARKKRTKFDGWIRIRNFSGLWKEKGKITSMGHELENDTELYNRE